LLNLKLTEIPVICTLSVITDVDFTAVMLCKLQEKDVYLLDDPLAAVDAHVARHLYSECIVGLLRNTTRILVTHHVNFLHDADFIVVVEGGQIKQIG